MQILGVRLHASECRLEAFIRADTGAVFRVPYTWFERDSIGIPPASWHETVLAEVRLRQKALPDRDVLAAFRKR